MSRRRFSSAATLIHDILDRYEKSGGTTRPAASIDNDGFATVDQRDAFDEALEKLERCGGVELIRSSRGVERMVTGARLRDASSIYSHVARQPAVLQVDDALRGLRESHDASQGVAQMLDATAAAWCRGVSFGGVARNDARTLEQVILLAQAVHARSRDTSAAEIDFRTFSRLSVGYSKALERNVRAVTSAIPRLFGPEHTSSGMEPEEFLGTLGIGRLPQPVLLGGLLSLSGELLPRMPFVGIPAESAELIQLTSRPDYIVTIENYTSFVRYVREVASAENCLVIFSGGFPSRPTLNVIARLAEAASAPTYHWGDMDAGGVRIFRHIERRLACVGVGLRLHRMDADLLRRVGSPVEDASRLTGNMSGSALADLAQLIRDTGLVHEQEELGPSSPMEASGG